jgi:DNA-binding IclR family transcriptional regulator
LTTPGIEEGHTVAGNGLQPRRSVTSKVVAILRSFGSGGSLTVTEIAQVANLPLSTTHRLVHELADWAVLHRGDDGRYEIVALSHSCGGTDCPPELRAMAAPVVEDLSRLIHSDVRLGLLDGLRVRYAEKAFGCQPFSAFSDAATLPAHATALGKALLAFSSPETVENVVRYGLRSYTSATITTAARLRHALKVAKLRGMAIARRELLPEHSAVAVPVFSSGGEAVAALEVRLREVPGELTRTVPALTLAARALSRDLGRAAPSQPATLGRRHRAPTAQPGSAEPIPDRPPTPPRTTSATPQVVGTDRGGIQWVRS